MITRSPFSKSGISASILLTSVLLHLGLILHPIQSSHQHHYSHGRNVIYPANLNLRPSETESGVQAMLERMILDGELGGGDDGKAEEGPRVGTGLEANPLEQKSQQKTEEDSTPVVTVYRNGVPVVSTSAVLSVSLTGEEEKNPSLHGSATDLHGSSNQISGLTASLIGSRMNKLHSSLFDLSSSSFIDDYEGTTDSPALMRGDSGSSYGGSLSRSYVQQHLIKRSFPFNMNNIEDIHSTNSYYMVDKSKWVTLWLHQSPRVSIILRPRLFGKTLALSYAQAYLDHCRRPTRALLDLYMLRNASQRQEHFHRHSIVALRLGHHSIMDTSSAVALEQAIVRYLESVLMSIMKSYRKEERDVPPEMRALYRRLCGKLPSRQLENWTEALQLMINLVHAFSGFTAAVLVDDYDEVLKKASELKAFDQVASFFSAFFLKGFNDGIATEKLFRAVVFGVQRFHEQMPFKEVRSHQYYALGDQHDPFAREFGFTQSEVTSTIGVFASELKAEALFDAFGGYYLAGSSTEFLVHPYGVAKSLTSQRISSDYWTRRIYIDFESPPFSNLAGFGVGNLYRLAGTKGDQPFEHRHTHMNLHSSSARSSSHDVLSFLRHAGLLLSFPDRKDVRVINGPAREFLVKTFQNRFAHSTGIINAWNAIIERNLEGFRMALNEAWSLPNFYDGQPPHACKRLSAFKELVERSASNYGTHVQSFQGFSTSKAAGNIFRFSPADSNVVILVSFAFTTSLVDETIGNLTESLLLSLKEISQSSRSPDQFLVKHCVSILFVSGYTFVGFSTDPKHLQVQHLLGSTPFGVPSAASSSSSHQQH